MASLESLKNPVTRLGVLGTAGSQSASFRRNEVNNSNIWDATKQYYLNDIVFSAIDGGAYVMDGGATLLSAAPLTAILGGDDPAVDWVSGASPVWVPLAANGPRVVEPANAQSATVVAGGAITFTNCNLLQSAVGQTVLLGDANYMAQIQFTLVLTPVAPATAILAADWANLTLTPTGGTPNPGTARLVTVQPVTGTGAQTNNFAASVYVPLNADGSTTSIVLTGAMNGASTATGVISNLNVSYVPLVP
jgi:hypothetical protein